MGSVLSYSGVSTKIRAMSSHLVTDEQLQEIVHFSDVSQVAAYLKKTPEYAKAWSDLDENNLHRGQIEKLLKKSIFGNFSRIYNFANKEQRKFLALYSKRYEIRVLKEILTNLFDHRSTDPVDMSPYRDFFLHHSKLDLDRLATAGNMEEFMNEMSFTLRFSAYMRTAMGFYLIMEWLLIFIISIRSGVSAKSCSKEMTWTRSPRHTAKNLIC